MAGATSRQAGDAGQDAAPGHGRRRLDRDGPAHPPTDGWPVGVHPQASSSMRSHRAHPGDGNPEADHPDRWPTGPACQSACSTTTFANVEVVIRSAAAQQFHRHRQFIAFLPPNGPVGLPHPGHLPPASAAVSRPWRRSSGWPTPEPTAPTASTPSWSENRRLLRRQLDRHLGPEISARGPTVRRLLDMLVADQRLAELGHAPVPGRLLGRRPPSGSWCGRHLHPEHLWPAPVLSRPVPTRPVRSRSAGSVHGRLVEPVEHRTVGAPADPGHRSRGQIEPPSAPVAEARAPNRWPP